MSNIDIHIHVKCDGKSWEEELTVERSDGYFALGLAVSKFLGRVASKIWTPMELMTERNRAAKELPPIG